MMNNPEIDMTFPKLNPSAWKQLIQFQLDGGDYAQQMIHHSLEGIDIKPFYTEQDINNPIDIPKSNWLIDERIAVYEDSKANHMALEAIEFGAESIHFTILNPLTNFKTLVAQINLEQINVQISLQQLNEDIIERIEQSNLKKVVFCVDPISKFYTTGNWYRNQKSDFELLSKFLKLTDKEYNTRIEIDNYGIAEAGAHNAYQIALILGHLAEYLHYFEEKGQLNLIKGVIFHTGVGSNYFFEIAKIRALRIVIPSVFKAFEIDVEYQLSSHTLSRYYTAYNAVQNLVRSSTTLLSSVLSTSDRISGLTHDYLIKFPNSKSCRLIRNQLLLLKHEAGLNTYQDAANGAYYINYLTEQLAQKGLLSFKLLEKNKGMIFQLKNGSLQKEIEKQHLKELTLYRENKEILIGANAYKDKDEKLKKIAQRKPFLKKRHKKTLIIPLIKRRIAAQWEEKRFQNE